jgi:hypothetical protein
MFLAGSIGIVGLLAAAVLSGSLPAGAIGTGEGALRGLMKDKNVFGPLVVLSLISLWSLRDRLAAGGRRVRILLGAMGAAMAVAVALSLSRAAWVSLLIAVAVLGLHSEGTGRRLLAWGVSGLTVAVLVMALLSPDLTAALTSRLGFMDYDLRDRFPMQLEALRLGLASPLGVGPAFFEETFRFSVHSVYCRLFAENGWASLGAYLGLLVQALLALWRRRWDPLALAFLTGLAIMAVNGLVIDTLHWRFFWVLAGAGLGYGFTCAASPRSLREVGYQPRSTPSHS